MVLTCRAHCSACGCHFRSTAAFDLHRFGSFRGKRGCRVPERVLSKDGTPRLRLVADDGTCDAYRAETGVDIWGEA